MAKTETDIVHRCMMMASACGATVFKNVRGVFLTLDGSRKVRAGLQITGSSDLIGWKSVVITPDMVGNRVAVIVCAEIKTPTGVASHEQLRFIDTVQKAGGIAGIVRSPDAMKELLD